MPKFRTKDGRIVEVGRKSEKKKPKREIKYPPKKLSGKYV
jgi:hypothetical protein